MAPRAGSLESSQAAVEALLAGQVSQESWRLLRESSCSLSFDLQVDIEHVSSDSLRRLAKTIGKLHPDNAAALWEWLALPASGESRPKKGQPAPVPRVQELLVVLGQVCGNAGNLVAAGGAAYLTLLAVPGADQQWSTLFQSTIFRLILRSLRCLRAEIKQREKLNADMEVEEERPEGEAEEGSTGVPKEDAEELLTRLVAFLRERSMASSAEGVALAIQELAELLLRPSGDSVARLASEGLAALVATAGGQADVRRAAAAVIRAAMPGILMMQERSAFASIPRVMTQSRTAALRLVRSLICDHPQLLTPQAPTAPCLEEEAEMGGQPVKKKRRGDGKETVADKDDEAEETAAAESDKKVLELPDGQQLVVAEKDDVHDGEKKARRKRPKACAKDDPIVALLELLCVLSPDRSEYRNLSADAVLSLLCEAAAAEWKAGMEPKEPGENSAVPLADAMEVEEAGVAPALPICEGEEQVVVANPLAPPPPRGTVSRFANFLEQILGSERVSLRVLATEVAVMSLERSGQLVKGPGSARSALVKRFLSSLVHRCTDAVPSVRSRALGGVATAVQFLSRQSDGASWLEALMADSSHAHYVDLKSLFRLAATDEKPMVRRASLGFFDALLPVLQGSTRFDEKAIAHFFELELVGSLSADESVLVRKASVSSMALLLRSCPIPAVCQLWISSVLPLLLDVEQTVVERALDELEAAVLNPLSEHAAACAKDPSKSPVAGLPPVLGSLDSDAMEYLQRGLRALSKRNEGKLPSRLVEALIQMVTQCLRPLPLAEWPLAAWSMLEEITAFDGVSPVSFDLVLSAWNLFSSPPGRKVQRRHNSKSQGTDIVSTAGLGGLAAGCAARGQAELVGGKILRTLENLVHTAPQEQLVELSSSLCSSLASFDAPTALIRGITSVVEQVEKILKAKKCCKEREAERVAWRAAFLKSGQSMLSEYVRHGPGESRADERQLCACLFTLGEFAMVDPSIISESIVNQVQTIATNTIWRDGARVDTPPAARGQAFAALGKFCLRKDALAKKTLELFVLHLNSGESFVVRNNALIVLGDLCVHYTSLVDRFVPCMTDLLRDENELLRKQASMILASLLAEDFIKFRGSIMLRFLYVLSDPSDTVRSLVESVFARILCSRNTTMFSQNFLDIICALNGWSGLAAFQGAMGNDDFSLQKAPSRRAAIYRFMLANMSNDQKFSVCAQIVTTLLAAFIDAEERTELPQTVGEPAGQALRDGLALLSCKEMRICFSTQKAGQDEELGDAEGANGEATKAGAEAARGVLSSILKRNMCENIVPVLIQLKSLMEAKHSPFLRQLRHCLREILRDFKDDLQVMLAGDQQLASEIAFDLQEEEGDKGESIAKSVMALQLGGASRRQSLGTMMKTPMAAPTPIAATPIATPIADACPPEFESPKSNAGVASSMPKARRSTGLTPGCATPTPARSKATPQLPISEQKLAVESGDMGPPSRMRTRGKSHEVTAGAGA
mmetsp:Transcript_34803/g.75882  ORF Transcript_34803/g.75882 Transcript_34803/m.75882 type:complete len:1483 (+) Transcript_34803:46-4494(+)